MRAVLFVGIALIVVFLRVLDAQLQTLHQARAVQMVGLGLVVLSVVGSLIWRLARKGRSA